MATRQIGNVLRKLHLNSSPSWHLVKGGSTDPPPYVEDVIYQRKVRIASATPAGALGIPFSTILGAAGLPAGSFTRMTILRVDAYGSITGAENGIRLSTNIITNDGLVVDRDFEDYGTLGARRPKVSIEISPKDQEFIDTSSPAGLVVFRTLDRNGTAIAGNVVVDFHCQFKNTAAETRDRKIDALWEISQERNWDPETPWDEGDEEEPGNSHLEQSHGEQLGYRKSNGGNCLHCTLDDTTSKCSLQGEDQNSPGLNAISLGKPWDCRGKCSLVSTDCEEYEVPDLESSSSEIKVEDPDPHA